MPLDWVSVLVGVSIPTSLALLPSIGRTTSAWWAVRANRTPSPPESPNKVLITGATKGLGNALAVKFLELGDDVTICSRTAEDCAAEQIRLQAAFPARTVRAIAADVADATSVDRLVKFAVSEMGSIDIWVNNAGATQGPRAELTEVDPDTISRVVDTTLVGAMLGSRAAIDQMRRQETGGKVFLMDGAGSDGRAMPLSVPYAAAKAAIPQLTKSLAKTVKGSNISVHCVSPGMVNTEMLRSAAGDNKKAHRVLNILAESPEGVAEWMVPRMRGVQGNGQYFKFLTPASALYRLATFSSRKGRFFPESAKAVVTDKSD